MDHVEGPLHMCGVQTSIMTIYCFQMPMPIQLITTTPRFVLDTPLFNVSNTILDRPWNIITCYHIEPLFKLIWSLRPSRPSVK